VPVGGVGVRNGHDTSLTIEALASLRDDAGKLLSKKVSELQQEADRIGALVSGFVPKPKTQDR
jgi:hypothetical protein